VDTEVQTVVAEDHDGWFGIRPGRRDLVAALVPGLLTFVADDTEHFVALAGGLLLLSDGRCQVTAAEAVLCDDLKRLPAEVDRQVAIGRTRAVKQRAVTDELAREALRRLAQEVRT
jgi:F-type H+-transporting ATPase subunit epsilon